MNSRNKSVVEQSINDLLQLLEEADLSEKSLSTEEYKNDILTFITEFRLKPGKNRVKTNLLHNIYTGWSSQPVALSKFSETIRNYFEYSKRHIFIDEDPIILTLRSYKEQNKKKINPLKSKWIKTNFEKFLKECQIQSGTYWVYIDNVYTKLYIKWYKNNIALKKLGKANFYKYCKLYFNHKLIKSQLHIQVNKATYDIVDNNDQKKENK